MLCCSKFDRYKLCRGKFIRSKFSCSNLGRSKFSRTKFGRSKFSRWIVQSYVFSEHAENSCFMTVGLCFPVHGTVVWHDSLCRERLSYVFSCIWNSCVTCFVVQGTGVYVFSCIRNSCVTCFLVQGTVVICFFLYMEQLCDMLPGAGNGCLMIFPVYGTVVWHVYLRRERRNAMLLRTQSRGKNRKTWKFSKLAMWPLISCFYLLQR
jgi:hypothetical protein